MADKQSPKILSDEEFLSLPLEEQAKLAGVAHESKEGPKELTREDWQKLPLVERFFTPQPGRTPETSAVGDAKAPGMQDIGTIAAASAAVPAAAMAARALISGESATPAIDPFSSAMKTSIGRRIVGQATESAAESASKDWATKAAAQNRDAIVNAIKSILPGGGAGAASGEGAKAGSSIIRRILKYGGPALGAYEAVKHLGHHVGEMVE